MFGRNKIASNIIYLLISLHNTCAWMLPNRCQPAVPLSTGLHSYDPYSSVDKLDTVSNIDVVVARENAYYKDPRYKFFYVPTRDIYYSECHEARSCNYKFTGPNSCEYYSFTPILISSVHCQEGLPCKLAKTVQELETYPVIDGLKWGAKNTYTIDEVFEIGGENSTDGDTYTCTNRDRKATTKDVECSSDNGEGGLLELYKIRSDLKCQYSKVSMVPEGRATSGNNHDFARDGYDSITEEEKELILSSNLITNYDASKVVLPNVEKIPIDLIRKVSEKFPLWNPYTDILLLEPANFGVFYRKVGSAEPGSEMIIPFSNRHDDAEILYTCLKS